MAEKKTAANSDNDEKMDKKPATKGTPKAGSKSTPKSSTGTKKTGTKSSSATSTSTKKTTSSGKKSSGSHHEKKEGGLAGLIDAALEKIGIER